MSGDQNFKTRHLYIYAFEVKCRKLITETPIDTHALHFVVFNVKKAIDVNPYLFLVNIAAKTLNMLTKFSTTRHSNSIHNP